MNFMVGVGCMQILQPMAISFSGIAENATHLLFPQSLMAEAGA